jgi:hypothetical protein
MGQTPNSLITLGLFFRYGPELGTTMLKSMFYGSGCRPPHALELLRNRLSSRYINITTNRYTNHTEAAAQPSPKEKTREKKEKTKPTLAAGQE